MLFQNFVMNYALKNDEAIKIIVRIRGISD